MQWYLKSEFDYRSNINPSIPKKCIRNYSEMHHRLTKNIIFLTSDENIEF